MTDQKFISALQTVVSLSQSSPNAKVKAALLLIDESNIQKIADEAGHPRVHVTEVISGRRSSKPVRTFICHRTHLPEAAIWG